MQYIGNISKKHFDYTLCICYIDSDSSAIEHIIPSHLYVKIVCTYSSETQESISYTDNDVCDVTIIWDVRYN